LTWPLENPSKDYRFCNLFDPTCLPSLNNYNQNKNILDIIIKKKHNSQNATILLIIYIYGI